MRSGKTATKQLAKIKEVLPILGIKESAIAEPEISANDESVMIIARFFFSITLTSPCCVVICGFQWGISSSTKWERNASGKAKNGFPTLTAIAAATIVCGVSSTNFIIVNFDNRCQTKAI